MARTNTTKKAKEPIRLRVKDLSNGNKSLYLDIYSDGKRAYEFLKLYLIPEHTLADKEQNKETLRFANTIKAQRVIEFNSGKANLTASHKSKTLLATYLQMYLNEHACNKSKTRQGQISTLISLVNRYYPQIQLRQVDDTFCNEFIALFRTLKHSHTGKPLTQNTIYSYYNAFVASLNYAVRHKLIQSNPCTLLDKEVKPTKESKKMFWLTKEELKAFTNIPCYKFPQIKQAFLFSCYCGLRYSDIINLKWGDLTKTDGQTYLNITMQKTKTQLNAPLSKKSLSYLPERGKKASTDFVFNLPSYVTVESTVQAMAKQAKIQHRVTFHTARHTFATLLITKGASVYTVSKLMGHSNVTITQIYAEVINEERVKATNLLNDL